MIGIQTPCYPVKAATWRFTKYNNRWRVGASSRVVTSLTTTGIPRSFHVAEIPTRRPVLAQIDDKRRPTERTTAWAGLAGADDGDRRRK